MLNDAKKEAIREVLKLHGITYIETSPGLEEYWAAQKNATVAGIDPAELGEVQGRRGVELPSEVSASVVTKMNGELGTVNHTSRRKFLYVSAINSNHSQMPRLVEFFDIIASQVATQVAMVGDIKTDAGLVPVGEKKAKDLLQEKCGCIFCGKPIEFTSVPRESLEEFAARCNASVRLHYIKCPSNPLVQALTFYADARIYKRKKEGKSLTIARQDGGVTAKQALGGSVTPLSMVAEKRILRDREAELKKKVARAQANSVVAQQVVRPVEEDPVPAAPAPRPRRPRQPRVQVRPPARERESTPDDVAIEELLDFPDGAGQPSRNSYEPT